MQTRVAPSACTRQQAVSQCSRLAFVPSTSAPQGIQHASTYGLPTRSVLAHSLTRRAEDELNAVGSVDDLPSASKGAAFRAGTNNPGKLAQPWFRA